LNKYFSKIKPCFVKNPSKILDYRGDNIFTFGVDTDPLKGDTLLRFFEIADMEGFYANIQNYNFKIPPTTIQIWQIEKQGWLDVHRDRGESKVSLNYYIDTSEDETIFYTPKDGIVREDYHVYDFEDLNIECSLSAKAGEAYLLNINELHSVTKKDDKTRVFLQYSWNEDYDTVLDSLHGLVVS
jgi:hypothetical protein